MLKGTDRLGNPDQAIPSRGETLAPLGATPLEDQTTGLGAHTRAEPVGTAAADVAGLERALHGVSFEFVGPFVLVGPERADIS